LFTILLHVENESNLDHSGRITFEEFRATIKALKLGLKSDDDIKLLFRQFDTTHNGQIDLDEFLKQLRPPMNARREKAVTNLFNSMDVNKDGELTISDLKTKYANQINDKKKNIDQVEENTRFDENILWFFFLDSDKFSQQIRYSRTRRWNY